MSEKECECKSNWTHTCPRCGKLLPTQPEAQAVTMEKLLNYVVHEHGCLFRQWREGRPKEDGGYETLYGYGKNQKWYPRGEEPPCTCGLNNIIAILTPKAEEKK